MHGSRLLKAASILLLTLFAATALASEKVTISTGEVVILSDDGTWNYEKRPVQRNKVIKTDRSGFRETNNCGCYGNGNIDGYNIWIDPSRMRPGGPQVRPPRRPRN
jgi:hypothetical protein